MTDRAVKHKITAIRRRLGREAAVTWGLQQGYSVRFSRDGVIVKPLV